ncbi:hypothetical protein M3221_15240 [Domibacillus indicus]|uniref:hypothetical protein n=1 Tax=Domibacillus indicus TaxID=1437523 RepID=UPI00203B99F3|nr:hypothetical protein [Domibacillus indicus]MCM3789748.1 hypothetical protein [Domibacillus indicus]
MSSLLGNFLSRASNALEAKKLVLSNEKEATGQDNGDKRLVAVGEVMGGFPNDSASLTFSIKYGNEEIVLEQFTYNVWETVKITLTTRFEAITLLKTKKPAEEVDQAIDKLLEKGLLIEWNDTYDENYFKLFSLVPKGWVTEMKENEYCVLTFRRSEPVSLTMMGYFLWRHAHSFLSCNSTIQPIHEATGVEIVLIREEFTRWIPILVMYDLLAIVPNR